MSFLSIPAVAGATIYLRVTNLNSGFVAVDNVSVRPDTKPVAFHGATENVK
jgi:hypothetical protein